MDSIAATLLGLMRRARFVFVVLYLIVSAGFLFSAPGSGWTWFIIVAGALVAFWTHVFARKHVQDDADGQGHD